MRPVENGIGCGNLFEHVALNDHLLYVVLEYFPRRWIAGWSIPWGDRKSKTDHRIQYDKERVKLQSDNFGVSWLNLTKENKLYILNIIQIFFIFIRGHWSPSFSWASKYNKKIPFYVIIIKNKLILIFFILLIPISFIVILEQLPYLCCLKNCNCVFLTFLRWFLRNVPSLTTIITFFLEN